MGYSSIQRFLLSRASMLRDAWLRSNINTRSTINTPSTINTRSSINTRCAARGGYSPCLSLALSPSVPFPSLPFLSLLFALTSCLVFFGPTSLAAQSGSTSVTTRSSTYSAPPLSITITKGKSSFRGDVSFGGTPVGVVSGPRMNDEECVYCDEGSEVNLFSLGSWVCVVEECSSPDNLAKLYCMENGAVVLGPVDLQG